MPSPEAGANAAVGLRVHRARFPLPSRRNSANIELIRLLEAVGKRDEVALSTLYNRTSTKLYGICLRLLPREEDAEEALQDVFFAVWQKAATYDASKAGPITWLAAITRYRAIDQLRKRQELTASIDEASDVPDSRPTASDVLEAKQQSERVADCLRHLETRQQAMIRAAFFEGATYLDLAKRESVPLGTMKSLIRRGLFRMRTSLINDYAIGHG
jgi:RNA polymerase sigma-70 factor (ECF subfamily)